VSINEYSAFFIPPEESFKADLDKEDNKNKKINVKNRRKKETSVLSQLKTSSTIHSQRKPPFIVPVVSQEVTSYFVILPNFCLVSLCFYM
jgi:hypothetical protein